MSWHCWGHVDTSGVVACWGPSIQGDAAIYLFGPLTNVDRWRHLWCVMQREVKSPLMITWKVIFVSGDALTDFFTSQDGADITEDTFENNDVMPWKRFPRYWLFVMGILRPPVDSHHQEPIIMLSFDLVSFLLIGWTSCWANSAGVLRRHDAQVTL